MARHSRELWPTFVIPVADAVSCPVEAIHLETLGAPHVRFDAPLPERAERFCRVYEGILRRLFRECTAFDDVLHVEGDRVRLNAIDDMSSVLIADFLRQPNPGGYAQLRQILRRHAASADVATLIICRNLGIPARRLASLEDRAAYWETLTSPATVYRMQKGPPSPKEMWARNVQYVVIEGDPPLVMCGQMSPHSSPTTQSLLQDKARASLFLRRHGHRAPDHVLIREERDLASASKFDTVIFKPTHGSGRRAVVGPVATSDAARVRVCYQRCQAQMPSSATVMAEQYIEGVHHRVNVNHGRVTFVAQSVRNQIVGDGTATIAQLVAAKRQAAGTHAWHADDYLENVICGLGFDMAAIPDRGERLTLSHDGNEGGVRLDVTDTFPRQFSAEALAIAATCRCPVMGIDAIVDAAQRLWIVEINATHPAVSLFDDPTRAYQTMEHMIRTVLRENNVGVRTKV